MQQRQSRGQQQTLTTRAAQAQQQRPTQQQQPQQPQAEQQTEIDRRRPAGNTGTLMKFLEANQSQLELFARGFMKPDAMIRMALIATTKSPAILKCSLSSILRALMDSAALRVRPGGLNGRGYLVPRRNKKVNPPVWEAHFDPGWRGLIDIARRSGTVRAIGAEVVRAGDEFEWGYNPLPTLKWTPLRDAPKDREIIAAFAVAQLADGAIQIEVVEGADLEKIKKASAAAESGPWVDWASEMCRKTAVKRLSKYLPVPDDFDELDKAMALSDSADTGERVIIDMPGEDIPIDGPPDQAEQIRGQLTEPTPSATEQLDALEAEAAEVIA